MADSPIGAATLTRILIFRKEFFAQGTEPGFSLSIVSTLAAERAARYFQMCDPCHSASATIVFKSQQRLLYYRSGISCLTLDLVFRPRKRGPIVDFPTGGNHDQISDIQFNV